MKKILLLFAILLVSACTTSKNDKKVEKEDKPDVEELLQKVDTLLMDSTNEYIDTEAYAYLEQFVDVLKRWKKNPANKSQKKYSFKYSCFIVDFLQQKKIRPGDYHRADALVQKMLEVWFAFDVVDKGNLVTFELNTHVAPRGDEEDPKYLSLDFIIDFDKQTKECQYIYILPPHEYDSTLLNTKLVFADDNNNVVDSITDFMENRDNGIILRADGKYFEPFLKYPHFYTIFELSNGETANVATRLTCFQKQYQEYFCKRTNHK